MDAAFPHTKCHNIMGFPRFKKTKDNYNKYNERCFMTLASGISFKRKKKDL